MDNDDQRRTDSISTQGSDGGLRFYWWASDSPSSPEGFPDEHMAEASVELAASIARLLAAELRWRSVPIGGAGDNGTVELITVVGGSLTILHGLLKLPGAAKEAWEHIAKFFARAKTSTIGWEASSEVAVIHCLARIQEEWPGAYTNPFSVKVIEDGLGAGMFADRPTGVHVIVVPDLHHKKTHIFAIDQDLTVHGHLLLDRLTADADSQEK